MGRFASALRQRGTFTIELALISGTIVLFLAFISDMTTRQNLKGNLQRMSYSAASIIKERTLLYGGEKKMTQEEFDELFGIIKHSMGRTMPGFVPANLEMVIEQLTFAEDKNAGTGLDDKPAVSQFKVRSNQACKTRASLMSMDDLFFETSYARMAPVYQVSLCYTASDWFGRLVKQDYSTVRVSSIMMER